MSGSRWIHHQVGYILLSKEDLVRSCWIMLDLDEHPPESPEVEDVQSHAL